MSIHRDALRILTYIYGKDAIALSKLMRMTKWGKNRLMFAVDYLILKGFIDNTNVIGL